MGGSVWEVVGGKDSGGVTVRTGKQLKSPEAEGGRLAHGALVAELELDGERLHFTRLTGVGPNEGWISLSMKSRPLVVRAGDIGSKAAAATAELEAAKAAGGNVQPKEGGHRLWILAQGSRGDVQPLLALAIAARKAGWAICFFASPENEDFIGSYGFKFIGTGADVRAGVTETVEKMDLKDEDQQKKIEEFKEDQGKFGGEALGEVYTSEVKTEIANTMMRELEKAKQAEEMPDAIFYHPLSGWQFWQAWAKYRVQVFAVDYTCMTLMNEEGWEKFADDMKESGSKDCMEAFGEDPFEAFDKKDIALWASNCYLTCTSKYMIYTQDWVNDMDPMMVELFKMKFLGPLIIDPSDQMVDLGYFGGQETLKRIQDFLDAGTRPAYVGWGSMPMTVPMLAKVLTTCKFIKQRCIVLGGWAGFTYDMFAKCVTDLMPEDPFGLIEYAQNEVLFVAVAPHEWLFQRCQFTVHHGGAGTTQAALRSGRPTIITPFSFDQFDFGKLVTNLGVGFWLSMVENTEKMMDPNWTKHFRKVANDKAMEEKAKEVAENIRKECGADGVMNKMKEFFEMKKKGELDGKFGCC